MAGGGLRYELFTPIPDRNDLPELKMLRKSSIASARACAHKVFCDSSSSELEMISPWSANLTHRRFVVLATEGEGELAQIMQ
jgi:hypothetical protein